MTRRWRDWEKPLPDGRETFRGKQLPRWEHLKEELLEDPYDAYCEVDEDRPSPEAAVMGLNLSEQMRKALKTLTPREEWALRMHFGIGEKYAHTLDEAAEKCGVSRERMRQITVKALRKLRHPTRGGLRRFIGGEHSEKWEMEELQKRANAEKEFQEWRERVRFRAKWRSGFCIPLPKVPNAVPTWVKDVETGEMSVELRPLLAVGD